MKKTVDPMNIQAVVWKMCAGRGSECVYLFQKNQYLTGIIQDRAWMTQLNMSDAYRFYGEGLDETIIEWLDEDV